MEKRKVFAVYPLPGKVRNQRSS